MNGVFYIFRQSMIVVYFSGNYTKVAILLENDKSQANKSSPDGATPLMYASITGQLHMIDLLISSGADIDARDYENGWTALMQATYYGYNDDCVWFQKQKRGMVFTCYMLLLNCINRVWVYFYHNFAFG